MHRFLAWRGRLEVRHVVAGRDGHYVENLALDGLDRVFGLALIRVDLFRLPVLYDRLRSGSGAIAGVLLDPLLGLFDDFGEAGVHFSQLELLLVVKSSNKRGFEVGGKVKVSYVEVAWDMLEGKALLVAKIKDPFGGSAPFDQLERDGMCCRCLVVFDWR